MSEKEEKKEKIHVRKATLNLRRKYGRTKQISIVERDAFIPKALEKNWEYIRARTPPKQRMVIFDTFEVELR